MAGSVVGAVAGGVGSAIAGRAFGGSRGGRRATSANVVPNFNFGGLAGSGGRNRLTISPGQERSTAVQRSANLALGRADALLGQRRRVRPGFGELTRARLSEIDSARRRTVGNLRENLTRRRLAGSSFAGDALVRAEREFAQASATARAESFLQELDLETQLIQQEFSARQEAVERTIRELDFQTQVGTQILSGVSAELGASARLEAELAVRAAEGRGAFFEPFVSQIGQAASDFGRGLFGGAE